MAPPAGGPKRKRNERTYSGENFDGGRPSPHRPGSLPLAQHGQGSPQHAGRDNQDYRGRGGRRGGRGGSGRGPPRSPQSIASPFNSSQQQRAPNGPSKPAIVPTPTSTPQSQLHNEAFRALEPRPETTVAATQTPPPEDVPTYYAYDYLDEDTMNSWGESGRDQVVNKGVQARKDQDILSLSIMFQEIIRSALDGRLRSTEAGATVKDILEENSVGEESTMYFNAPSVFLDTLTMFAPDTNTKGDNTKERPLTKREIAVFKPLLLSCGISTKQVFEELEGEHLSQIGLTRSTFWRMCVRHQTNVLYRQSNYNLLREESEGYSKLITELFTTSGNEPPSAEVVAGTFERVKAMIGAFDLDVGRVLDITLDTFAAVLVRKYRFFVKYLRASTWWPQQPQFDKFRSSEFSFRTLPVWASPDNTGFDALSDEDKFALAESRVQRDTAFWDRVREVGIEAFFELGGKRLSPDAVAEELKKGELSEESKAWLETTGVLPPTGNVIAAQVLGFKLRFYNSDARSATDTLPNNLIWLSALLIKIGFITLKDLYPHLWPKDEAMTTVKEEKTKEKEEREKTNRPGGASKNALAMAGALSDDTVPASTASRLKEAEAARTAVEAKSGTPNATDAAMEPKEDLPEPSDQKIQLLRSLLLIGAIPEALFMLGQYPWLIDVIPDLPDHFHRILHHCLSKVYEPLQPLKGELNISMPHTMVDPDQSGVAKGNVRRIDQPAHKTLRWAQLDKFEPSESVDYTFYWEEWTDNVPVCQSIDDVFTLCNTLLSLSGVKIGKDAALLTKLARIGKHSYDTDHSESNRARWIDLSKRLLVPALSLTEHIPGVVDEIWNLIRQFPTSTRFSIYAEWYHGAVSRSPDMKTAFDQSRAETKDCLKRISKTNLRPMARALAKVATASPGIVFSVAVSQIEAYDNLVDVVVECGRYFTFLGYDVLTWSIMNALGTSRTRVQADGMLTSNWLRALSLFAGKIFKRYHNTMNPTPLLQYVLHQLQKGNPTDLIVLGELISSMAGIVSDTDFNDAQVIAMAGGKALQSQTMLQLLDRRHETSMRITAKRLLKSLIDPARLAGPILIAIAQERQTCVFSVPEPDAHLKLLGNLFDKIHRILVQYLDLLRSNLSAEEFDDLVPSLSELIGEYGLDPSVAFWISRPSITTEMAEHDKKVSKEKKDLQTQIETTKAQDKEDVQMVNGEPPPSNSREQIAGDIETPSKGDEQKDTEMKDAAPAKSPEAASPPKSADGDEPWHPVLQKTIEATRPLLPEGTFSVLSETFYFTFWQMSLEDIFVPMSSYEEENQRLKKKAVSIGADRSDLSVRGTQKKEDDKKANADLQSQLQAEMGTRIGVYQRCKQRLSREKELWFQDCWGKWDALNVAILEHCFIPRIVLSPIDALYTFKLLKHLHNMGTKYFRTVGLFDQLFNKDRLVALFFLSTDREADNIGRFLNEAIKDLQRWHKDKVIYEKEAHGPKKDLPGFCVKHDEDRMPQQMMDYEDFRRICDKWHRNLTIALRSCFQGGEYMHIRNAIAILKAMVANFPMVDWMGISLVKSLEELGQNDKRDDIKLAANALIGHLKKREKEWTISQAFSIKNAQAGQADRKANAKDNTPQTEAKLNAKAAEFKPRLPTNTNGVQKPAPITTDKVDLEDGEVKSALLPPENSEAAAKANELDQSKHAPKSDSSQPEPKDEQQTQDPLHKADTPQSRAALPEKPNTFQSPKPREATPKALPSKVDQTPPRQSNLPGAPRPAVNGRSTSHVLPQRPEPTPPRGPDRRDRPSERSYADDSQSRYSEHRRDGHDYPSPRDSAGYHSSSYGSRHDRDRQEASWNSERGHSARLPPDPRYDTPTRDSRTPRDDRSDRGHRDRPAEYDNSRGSDSASRQSREGAMAPPRQASAAHLDRVAPLPRTPQEDLHGMHPKRRAEIARSEGQAAGGAQRSSRGPSPSRRERDDHNSRSSDHQYREDRQSVDSRRAPEERSSRSHHEDGRLPSGPRSNRAVDHPGPSSQSDRFRDSFPSSSLSTGPAHEPSRSRHTQNDRSQESNFGRLNAEPPAGPRTNGPQAGRGGRAMSSNLPPVNTQNVPAQPSIAEKQTPTGPASGRGGRGPAPFTRPAPASGPPTPSTESPDTAGIHPDRLRKIAGPEASQDTAPPAAAPSGPRGPISTQAPNPTASRAPNTQQQVPPTERPTRGGGADKRLFAGINSMLSQPGQPSGADRSNAGPNIRGRGAGRGAGPLQPPAVTGPPPRKELEPVPPPRDSRDAPVPSRPELFAGRGAGGPAGGPYREDDRSKRDLDRRSSGRHDTRAEEQPRHSGPPQPLPAGPRDGGRLGRDDGRGPPRRSDEPQRRDEVRDIRGRAGGPLPPPERDMRRPPRDEPLPLNDRDMRRDHDNRRDSGRDAWASERMPQDRRDRRDVGPDRRDHGPPMDQGGSFRRKRGAPEEPFDQSKRSRR